MYLYRWVRIMYCGTPAPRSYSENAAAGPACSGFFAYAAKLFVSMPFVAPASVSSAHPMSAAAECATECASGTVRNRPQDSSAAYPSDISQPARGVDETADAASEIRTRGKTDGP